jgi:hypothetical protein
MGRAQAIQFQPLPLRHWLDEHQRIVRSSLVVAIALLIVAIAALTVAMFHAAISIQPGAFVTGGPAISHSTLPREWSWSIRPVTFEHMYRDDTARLVIDYTRQHPRTRYQLWSE